MAQTHEQVGRALVMLSVVAAVLVVVWLYRWEQKARTAEAVPPPGEGAPAAPLSPQLKAGQQAYMKLCDSCHPGGGAGLGPSVLGLSQEQFSKATREGKGTMPAYTTSRLRDQDLEAMYVYLKAPPAATPAPTAAPARPPAIPHPLEGREACLTCHGSGIPGIPQAPANHAGRTNDSCRLCHTAAPARTPAATATPTPATTPTPAPTATPTPPPPTPAATPTPTATPRPTSSTPPAIPHTLEGRSACLACHASGAPGIVQMPPSHTGRTSQMCTLCHSPGKG